MASIQLQYDRKIMDTTLAKEFKSHSALLVQPNVKMIPFVVDLYGNKLEFPIRDLPIKPKKIEACPSFKGIRESIIKRSNLICQLEYNMRGILPSLTKKELEKIFDNIEYYGKWASLVKIDSKTKNLIKPADYEEIIFDFDNSLSLPFPTICAAVAIKKSLKVRVCSSTSAVMLAFADAFAENGFLGFDVLYDIHTDLDCSTTYKKGTSVFVFENSDQDSAIDSIISGAWSDIMSLWRIKHICVQESIHKAFLAKLTKKLSLLKFDLPQNYKPGKALEKAKIEIDRILKIAVSDGIEFISPEFKSDQISDNYYKPIIVLDNLQWFKKQCGDSIPIVSLQAFRTTKEALSLNKTLPSQAVSVWCTNNSICDEFTLSINANCIWVNTFGHFSPLVNLEVKTQNSKFFYGGTSSLIDIHASKIIDIEKSLPANDLKSKSGIEKLQTFYEKWKIQSVESRSSTFLKLIESLPVDFEKKFIGAKEIILESAAECRKLRNENIALNKHVGTEFLVPVGICLIENADDLISVLKIILNLLIFGNGVLVFNQIDDVESLSELFIKTGLPVTFYSKKDQFNPKFYEPIKVCIRDFKTYFEIYDLNKLCRKLPHSFDVYKTFFSNRKIIWSSYGETFSN